MLFFFFLFRVPISYLSLVEIYKDYKLCVDTYACQLFPGTLLDGVDLKSLELSNVTRIAYTWKVNTTKAPGKRRAKGVRATVRKQRSGAGTLRGFPRAVAWPDTRLAGVGGPRNEGRVFQIQRCGERSGVPYSGKNYDTG